MKARDFGRHFGKVTDQLKAGETLEVTKRGQVHGHYTRAGKPKKKIPAKLLDFSDCGYTPKEGDAALKKMLEDVS